MIVAILIIGVCWLSTLVFTYSLYQKNILKLVKVVTDGTRGMADAVQKQVEGLNVTTKQHVQWQNELHALLLREESKSPKQRIYAFNVVNPMSGMEQMRMIAADSMDEAEKRLIDILHNMGHDFTNFNNTSTTGTFNKWVVKSHTFIDIPVLSAWDMRDSLTTAEKEAEGKVEFDRPILAYVNYLEFARDKFAQTASEKKTLNSVIFRIRKYEHDRTTK